MLLPKSIPSSNRSLANRSSNAVALNRPLFHTKPASQAERKALWNPVVSNQLSFSERALPEILHKPIHTFAHPFQSEEVDLLYLFACHAEWGLRGEPSAAWEIVQAANSRHEETRAHARALLAASQQVKLDPPAQAPAPAIRRRRYTTVEANVKTPYGLDIIESCTQCAHRRSGFFCNFSGPALQCLEQASHHTTLPAGAILFVEGQVPRGIFVLCSGRVKLSTASREGKVLILKFAEAGEALGLSAVISAMNYEMTAETATPCQLNFIDRKNLMNTIEGYAEAGMNAAQSLSKEFQFAYRDMHDLVLARSSTGKLARLLLSSCADSTADTPEVRVRSGMTHEEMAQRIGASRETVTRLLSDLKRRHLIRLDGATLVIRDRLALETLVV